VGRWLIKRADFPVWLRIPDVPFKIRGLSITHRALFSSGFQEPNAQVLALTCMRRLGLSSFWDVGANIGYYTWLLKAANPRLRCVMFEPLAENVRLIQRTISLNNLGAHIELVSAAASDRSGSGMLHVDLLGSATSSLEEGQTFQEHHYGVAAGQQRVRLVSIDEERNRRVEPVDLLKIDVEGHEESVLRGALQTIGRDQPIIFVECHGGRRPFSDLSRMGYRFIDADLLSCAPPFCESSMLFFALPQRFCPTMHSLLAEARAATIH